MHGSLHRRRDGASKAGHTARDEAGGTMRTKRRRVKSAQANNSRNDPETEVIVVRWPEERASTFVSFYLRDLLRRERNAFAR